MKDLPENFSDLTEFKETSWSEFREAARLGKYSIGIDATRANEVAKLVGTGLQKSWLGFLVLVPLLTAVALLVGSFLTGKYLLLVGVPLVFIAQLLAAGMVVRQGCGLMALALLAATTWYALESGRVVLAGLAATVLIQLFTRRLWYLSNVRIARGAIEQREPAFLLAFVTGITSVQDNVTGERIWAEKR